MLLVDHSKRTYGKVDKLNRVMIKGKIKGKVVQIFRLFFKDNTGQQFFAPLKGTGVSG